jgi:hypothetical protein
MLARQILDNIRILPISSLKPHETTTREATDRLKGMIRASKYAKSPIMVAKDSLIVLDGMHRIAAFSELGYKNILCQMVDYQSPKVLIGLWYPSFASGNPLAELRKATETLPSSYEDGMAMLCNSRAAFLLAYPVAGKLNWALVCPCQDEMPLERLVEKQGKIVASLAKTHKIAYIPDYEVKEHAEASAVLIRRPFRKQEIISLAEKGVLLPPKSTRHMFPIRAINVNMPLGWLKLPLAEANKKLQKLLSASVEKGELRHYPEPVLVIDDARSGEIRP